MAYKNPSCRAFALQENSAPQSVNDCVTAFRSRLLQPNESKRYRKAGLADCGNDFSNTLQKVIFKKKGQGKNGI